MQFFDAISRFLILDPLFGLTFWTTILDAIFQTIFKPKFFRLRFWTPILAVWKVLISNHPNICTQNIQTIMPMWYRLTQLFQPTATVATLLWSSRITRGQKFFLGARSRPAFPQKKSLFIHGPQYATIHLPGPVVYHSDQFASMHYRYM